MSVPKYKRNTSKIHFFAVYNDIRRETISVLMRDFGIKARSYSVHLLEDIYDLSEEDKKIFEDLSEKYGIESYDIDKYPDWIINSWRNEILAILSNISIEIQCANAIYITNIQEYYNRRNHWNNAIGFCMALMGKLHEIIACIRVKVKSYEHIFELLNEEIRLLKAVRKSDNRYKNQFNDELPYFNNNFVYNNYPVQPFVPNYCANNNVEGPYRKVEICRIVDKDKEPAPEWLN